MDKIEEIASGRVSRRPNNSTSNLAYVDWGGALRPRSFGRERIEGDIKPHYRPNDNKSARVAIAWSTVSNK